MAEELSGREKKGIVDRFGAVASTACAIHCAVCALAPATFAALGVGFLVGHEVEWLLTLVAVGFGLVALFYVWKSHRDGLVVALLALGIVGLLAVRGLEGGHHDEHEDSGHAETGEHDGEQEDHEKEEKAEAEAEHDEKGDHGDEEHHDEHGSGEAFGILAGLVLMGGHVRNLKVIGRNDCSE